MATRRDLPADVAAAFERVPEARERFAALPADRQVEWLKWIDRGRGRRGRARRIDEMIRRLLPAATAAQEEEVAQPVGPPPDRFWWLWLVLLLLVVVGGLLAWFLLTRGDDKTTVPNVIGLTEQAAAARIHDRGLDVVPRVGESGRPQGIVFAQRPGPGTQVGKNQSVTIFISSGGIVVPDVTGLPLPRAVAELKKKRLAFEVRRVASTRPKDVVVGQVPAPGVKAVGGTTVKLSVSSGVKPVVVPSVVGQTQGAAVAALTKLGLRPVLKNVPSAQPAGIVVGQKPPAGKEVDKGAEVIVAVSTGTAPTTTLETTTASPSTTTTAPSAAGRVPVPQVRGTGVVIGLRRLNAAQLRPVVRYVASPQPAGRIVFQSPAGGTAPRGARVRIQVSTGPHPAPATPVPDVTGQDRVAAVSALRTAGFHVLVLYRKTTDQTEDGIVVDEQPGAGSSIPRGSLVAIFVGRVA
jgi:beta-lactam-binding protein with PASTA domain